jgi:hypothetical protein
MSLPDISISAKKTMSLFLAGGQKIYQWLRLHILYFKEETASSRDRWARGRLQSTVPINKANINLPANMVLSTTIFELDTDSTTYFWVITPRGWLS